MSVKRPWRLEWLGDPGFVRGHVVATYSTEERAEAALERECPLGMGRRHYRIVEVITIAPSIIIEEAS